MTAEDAAHLLVKGAARYGFRGLVAIVAIVAIVMVVTIGIVVRIGICPLDRGNRDR